MSDACPKCGLEKSGASCPKCGLVFAKFDPRKFEDGTSESLRLLWKKTQSNWENPGAHLQFIEQALDQSEAGFVARCYRSKGNDPIAQKHLADLTRRIEQTLFLTKSEKYDKKNQTRYALAFALLLLGATIAFLLMRW